MNGMRLLIVAGVLAVVNAVTPSAGPGFVAAVTAQGGTADPLRVAMAEFKKLHESGKVIVLDVRAVDTYLKGHIPAALSVPLETVAPRAKEWMGATMPIVTYCT
jgi:3-mercaptopyruvate sulfurtransferase SseA